MHIISYKAIREFSARYRDAKVPLDAWYKKTEKADWKNIAEVKQTFPHADAIGDCTVFNIGGNKVRLIAAIHYNRDKIYIRQVLTHQEYDTGEWKE